MDATVIVVGQEILDGFTLDTNTNWLTARLHELGIRCRRVTTIPDEDRAIAATLLQDLEGGPKLIFIGGGLGPTPDDVTVAAVGEALGAPLERHPEVWKLLQERLRGRGDVTEAVRRSYEKMALVPKGGIPLRNRAGAAPGILLHAPRPGGEATRIFVLPGVPKEFKAIFTDEIESTLHRGTVENRSVVELHTSRREGEMFDLLEDVTVRHPAVSVGSYPQSSELVILRIQGPKGAVDRAAAEVEAGLDRLVEPMVTIEMAEGLAGGRNGREPPQRQLRAAAGRRNQQRS